VCHLLVLTIAIGLTAATQADPLVDPTRPSGFAVAAPGATATGTSLRLTLIRLGAQPLAIVNGRSLRPGDVIDGKRLTAIQPGRVLLAGSDGPLELRLLPSRGAAPSTTSHTSSPSIKRRPTL
jgi:hypothetical protein